MTQCVDCRAEGVNNSRPVKPPGPRCATHARQRREIRRSSDRARRLRAVYDISLEEYAAILEYQGGACYICRRAKGIRKALSVDHNHETGDVRGLLCTSCNKNVLGHLRDDPEALQRAIDYLKNPPAHAVIGIRIVPDHKNLTSNEAA